MRLITTVIAGLLVIGAGAFFLLRDTTYTLKFSETDLRAQLEDRLPFSEDYLFIFNVTLENPRVDLIEGSDRIAGGLDTVVNVKLGDEPLPISGAIDLSGGLRYAPEEGAFYLTDPRIETVRLAGVPDRHANRANSALSLALAEFYRERPIYILSDDDMRQRAARLVLRDIEVKNEVLHVELGMAPKAD
ncbi:MAG: DUF1439 domain-containing protein [Pseudomonadota bacterium]